MKHNDDFYATLLGFLDSFTMENSFLCFSVGIVITFTPSTLVAACFCFIEAGGSPKDNVLFTWVSNTFLTLLAFSSHVASAVHVYPLPKASSLITL